MVRRGMKSSCIIIECKVEQIFGDSAMTSCKEGRMINGGDKVMQQRFFSRTPVLIRGEFHREAVTDNASVPPNENPEMRNIITGDQCSIKPHTRNCIFSTVMLMTATIR